jgi:hypothetical protein
MSKPWRDPAEVEGFLSDYFNDNAARGTGGMKKMLSHPLGVLHAWQAIARLAVLEVPLGSSDESKVVRRGLLRTNTIARALVRGTTAVLEIPENGQAYREQAQPAHEGEQGQAPGIHLGLPVLSRGADCPARRQ